MTAPIVVCVHCRQTCTQRFEITRYDRAGVAQPVIVCCSISHLLSWGYEYATIGGMRIAYGAKQSFDSFMTALRGGKLL